MESQHSYEPCRNRVGHVDGSLRTSDAVSLYFCMVRSVGLSCKGACRKHPVHSILSFNAFRLFEKKSPPSDNHSWKDIPSDVGVLCFLIISVRYRHFYCFGANRIKIAKSVQKTSKSNIFCTDFIIFPILAKISSYKRPKSPAFVFFQQKTAFSIQTELPEWWQPILQRVVDIFLKSVRRQGQCGHDVIRRF